jgi:transcriptional regulator with XRE-family HTH domain
MNQLGSASRYLAINLLALRKKKSLSQNKLSELADIPRSTITHMESGEGNPSLTNLCKLAAALSISIEELLSRPRNECTLLKAADVSVSNRSSGKVRVHRLMPDTLRGIEIDRVEIQGRSSMGGRPHVQGSKEYLMTLAGEVIVSVDGEDYTVAAGDVLAFPGDQRHAYRNGKSRPAVALSVVLPMPYLLDR